MTILEYLSIVDFTSQYFWYRVSGRRVPPKDFASFSGERVSEFLVAHRIVVLQLKL